MASTNTKKSVFVAYLLWLFGGIFGAHHFYLKRDCHGLVWWSTLGGFFGIGWLFEAFKIPTYVKDANDDPKFMEAYTTMIKETSKPPFSSIRFTGMILVSYLWGQVFLLAIPEDEVYGINWKFLYILTPLVTTLGVWVVGNIGREKGKIWLPLLAAYLIYPIRYLFYDESIWFSCVIFGASVVFDGDSKSWRRKPRKNRCAAKRIAIISSCMCLYLALWGSYLYFNGTITDNNGDEIPVHEALHHFYTSPWWVDLKNSLHETYLYAQQHGWYEVWNQIIDLSDIHGEQNAHKVLGVGPDASQQDITAAWRKLSKENHPDKVKDETLRRQAQEKFMEIQQAYDILSNSKHRRNRRNKKDNSN